MVILIFIFLTPKSWFDSSERKNVLGHQNPSAIIVTDCTQVIDTSQDNVSLERCLRETTRRPDLRIQRVRKLTDDSGKIKGYEVDIR